MASTVQKNFTPNSKDIRYLNKDFNTLRQALISFSKTYYPNTFQDFSPASPGMMFIEQAAYVGDVLSYYTDYAFKEGVMSSASERRNIVNLAGYLGYKVQPSRAATGTINIYQICPSATDGEGNYFPDPNYMLLIKENAQFSNKSLVYYVLNQSVDFTINTAQNPRVDTVYSRNSDGTPEFFLLQKSGPISAGQILQKQQVVLDPQAFYEITLDEDNVLGIVSVVDSDNNIWYEVDYMAQELVPIAVPNDVEFEGSLNQYKDSVPYILNFLKTSRRFITIVDENNLTTLQFGAGINGVDDEIVTFDSNLIGIGLSNAKSVNIPLDPSNFLNNENYGIAPTNTTLTIQYLVGGGLASNSQTGEIINIVSMDFANSSEGLLPEQVTLLNTVENSVQVTNPAPTVGGEDAETDDEIKMNAVANFAAQSRAVTQDDFLVRIYSLPAKFGSVAKAQVVADTSLSVGVNKMLSGVVNTNNIGEVLDTNNNNYFRQLAYDVTNPFAINVYLLSYDANKQLTQVNPALITNIITYLKQFRMMTDGVNIIDGYIINIGVDFVITVYKGFNKKDVLSNCITAVQNFFDIDKWNFSQPINLSQLQLEIAKVDGVQSVVSVDVSNKTVLDGIYSPIQYDISAATKNGIIYPSTDPSIFEIKYPDSDIKGSTL
jgi:hypothetical protein